MRFLVDNALSPLFVAKLRKEGHDAIHVRDISLESASDEEIFNLAFQDKRTIVSADTDFGTIMALRNKTNHRLFSFENCHNADQINK